MSCSCLGALLKALQPPWGALPAISIPPIVAKLGSAAPGLGALKAGASAQLSALASLSLPPLPIPAATLAAAAGLVATAGQVRAGLGVDLFSAGAGAQMSAMIGSFNLLPFDLLTLPEIEPLGSLCSTLLMVKASLGIDLLAPGAAVALQAALNVMATATATATVSVPAAKLSLLASYSVVANLAAAFGVGANFGALGAKLSAFASLQLPGLAASPLGLAKLLQYLAALAAAKSLFGLNPFAVGMSAKLGLALAPLQALASVTMSESLSAAAGAAAAAGAVNLNANFSAIAAANLSAMASLKLPSLAPLSIVAAIAAQARGSSPCGSGCPIGI